MSEEKQPKKSKPSEDDKSEHSDEPRNEPTSPDDAEDKSLLSVPPAAGAEALPVASGSGTQSSSASEGLSSLFRKISPFKKKESSKAKKPPTKKLKKDSSFVKAKNAFRKTFRRSDPIIKGPEGEDKRRRKYSDPTDFKTKIEQEVEEEQTAETDLKPKKGLFGYFSGSSSKGAKEKTKEPKVEKEPKAKKESKPKKGFFGQSSASTSKTSPEAEKKVVSAKSSYHPSEGVSVSFFGEDLLPSSSSGVSTKSTTVDVKSPSPDATASKQPTPKRRRSTIETDEEFSSD